MIKKCHGLDIELECSIKANSTFIVCYVRNFEIVLTPEEEVRQAILKVIHEHLNVDMNHFITRVEFQCLDIAFYYKYPIQNFQPSQYPFLIIETKRDYTNLLCFENQLLNYLKLNYCPNGLLLNCHSIYFLSKNLDYKPVQIYLDDISDIFNDIKLNIHDDVQDFNNAKNGDIESFKRLALKFGRNSKVQFLCKDYSAPIIAFLFDFKHDYILFDVCGIKAGVKKHRFKQENFVRLISIND